ncbi:hypothetical protein BPNPMPFG_004394 [Mesorhizobium sp. AR07]|nr:hypothetical protein BPNPMPFG_004394 [Mesorhizobium sp. AR07]
MPFRSHLQGDRAVCRAAVVGVLTFVAHSSDTARGPVFLLILFAVGCLG